MSTTNTNNLDSQFLELVEETDRLNLLIKEAKTELKKQYYKKKLEKIKQRAFKNLFMKALNDPELLKKVDGDKTDE